MNVEDINYPETPDARGNARKYVQRKAYYFGRHNSPASHVLFGIWKQHFQETGQAPEVSIIRPILDELGVGGKATTSIASKSSLVQFAALVSLLFVVIVLASKIYADSLARSSLAVDGQELSGQEIDVVRGYRFYTQHVKPAVQNAELEAQYVEKIRSMGIREWGERAKEIGHMQLLLEQGLISQQHGGTGRKP